MKENRMIYFTADLHLGHKNVISLCRRPFSSLEEMDECLIANWNQKVKDRDTVYIVGDLFWDKKWAQAYLPRLSGQKILITGNHDPNWLRLPGIQEHFQQILPYLQTKIGGHTVTLCHYPLLEWQGSRDIGTPDRGYLIHGHIHNRQDGLYLPLFLHENALNAGVDINHFAPVTLEELINNNRQYKQRVLSQPR